MTNEGIKTRAKEIVDGLSIGEKLSQLLCMFIGPRSQIPVELLYQFKNGLGEIALMPSVSSAAEDMEQAKQENEILSSMEKLPPLRHNEALTGQMTRESTVFPSAIALGASFDPQKVQDMADVIRRQMLAEGTRHALSPVMDVARDLRWGRVGETYGEDPTLCAAMSVAFVKGLQSDDLADGVMATGKHFLGYALSEGGLNMAANPIPYRELREVYAKPFQAAITEANLGAIMNSYGTIDNELIITSKEILTKLLREEMGFDGLVVSDYMSINKAVDLKLFSTPGEAGAAALKAGLDIEMPMPYGYNEDMVAALFQDPEGMAALDRAVTKMVEAKLKLGLFDGPSYREDLLESAYDRSATMPLSLQLAKESIVLVKNEGILPFSKKVQKVALIGPHADSIRLLFGCYTYPAAFDRDVSGSMSDMPGMQAQAQMEMPPSPYQMPYLPGCSVRGTHAFVEESLKTQYAGKTPTIKESLADLLPDAEIRTTKGYDVAGTDRSDFANARELTDWADIVILTAGGKYGWGTSCTTGEGIDTDRIGLPGVQKELVLELAAAGKPLALVHMDSKPLCDEEVTGAVPAIVENWFPGDTGGEALAAVLFGDYNPAGRLPITAARSAGQIPIYHGQKRGSGYHPGAGMTIAKYVEGEKTPLYAFGHGLSYTNFAYSDLAVTKSVASDGAAEISLTVTNQGSRGGEEVVQLYISDAQASMIRPEQELAGFKRLFLNPGESMRVTFQVRADQFAFLDRNNDWVVEAGDMDVLVGAASNDIRLMGSFTITDTRIIDPKTRGFYAKSSIQPV